MRRASAFAHPTNYELRTTGQLQQIEQAAAHFWRGPGTRLWIEHHAQAIERAHGRLHAVVNSGVALEHNAIARQDRGQCDLQACEAEPIARTGMRAGAEDWIFVGAWRGCAPAFGLKGIAVGIEVRRAIDQEGVE